MTNPIMTEAQAREEAAKLLGAPELRHLGAIKRIADRLRANFAPLSAIEERDATIARLNKALLIALEGLGQEQWHPTKKIEDCPICEIDARVRAIIGGGQTP